MTDKSEKARRKEILRSQREENQRSVREGLPMTPAEMKMLFDYIDEHLSLSECYNTLRFAREFLKSNALPEEQVVAWLEAAGGYCDCEAIGNAEELLEDSMTGSIAKPRASTGEIE